MKKLLAMILMAAITLPVFAKEVTLRCKLSNGETEIWGFDEANGTVTSEEKKFSIKAGPISEAENEGVEHYKYYATRKYFITPTEFGFWRYNTLEDKTLLNKLTISRMDGDYRWSNEYSRNSPATTGTCAPFKQAF